MEIFLDTANIDEINEILVDVKEKVIYSLGNKLLPLESRVYDAETGLALMRTHENRRRKEDYYRKRKEQIRTDTLIDKKSKPDNFTIDRIIMICLIIILGILAIIGFAIGLVKTVVSDSFFLSYQNYASVAFGVVIVVIGITTLRKSAPEACAEREHPPMGVSKLTRRFDIRAFSMGFTRGLILCPPLIALLLYSVTFSQIDSIILAVLFGVGTTISPLLVLGGATGWLLNKAPLFKKWTSRIGGFVLVILGLIVVVSAFGNFLGETGG